MEYNNSQALAKARNGLPDFCATFAFAENFFRCRPAIGNLRAMVIFCSIRTTFLKRFASAAPAPMRFFSYKDPEQNTREQINTVRSHPWISKDVPVRGFIFDMETGLLREVQPIAKHAAA